MKKYKFYILLFTILLVSYGYFFHWIGGWNESTRLDLTYSIVERHSFNIDPYHENTGDKAFRDGHYYCDKAPGLSFFAVPAYVFVKTAIKLLHLPILFNQPNSLTVFYFLTLICVGIPSALLGVLFYKFIGYFTDNKNFQLAVALSYSLATMAFPYATLFVGHQFCAVLGFVSFLLAFRMKQGRSNNSMQLFLIGLITGYAVISEYPMVIIAAALSVYVLSFLKHKEDFTFFILGALGPVLLFMYYNYACFGSPFLLSYKFEAPNPEFAGMKEGLFGVTNFKLSSLYGITFGLYRGLFRTSPLLLLSIPGFYYLFKKRAYRPEFYFSIFVVSAFILLNSSYYAWYGGATMGPRHIIPILPFMSFPLIFYLERFRGSGLAKSIFKILFLFSFLFMLFGTAVDPRLPPANIDLNSFIILRLLYGSYTPNPTFFYHSFNLGAIAYIYLAPYLLRLSFILTLLPLLIFLFFGMSKLLKFYGKQLSYNVCINIKNKYISAFLIMFFAIILYAGIAGLYINIHGKTITSLLCVGEEFKNDSGFMIRDVVPKNIYLWEHSQGYDGQFYYLAARDPFCRTDLHRYVDSPSRRYQRIIYILMAWIFSLGNADILPYVMFLINFLSFLMGLFFIIKILEFYNKNIVYSIFYIFFPGFFCDILRCLPGTLSLCFLLASIYCYLKSKNIISAVLICLAMLTYELAGIVAIGYVLFYIYKKNFKNILIFLAPIIALFVWHFFIFLIFKKFPIENTLVPAGGFRAMPILSIIKAIIRLQDYLGSQLFLLQGSFITAVILAVFESVGFLKKEISPITISFLCYAVFAFCFAWEVDDPWGNFRILNGLFMMLLLSFAAAKQKKAIPASLYFIGITFLLFIKWNFYTGNF